MEDSVLEGYLFLLTRAANNTWNKRFARDTKTRRTRTCHFTCTFPSRMWLTRRYFVFKGDVVNYYKKRSVVFFVCSSSHSNRPPLPCRTRSRWAPSRFRLTQRHSHTHYTKHTSLISGRNRHPFAPWPGVAAPPGAAGCPCQLRRGFGRACRPPRRARSRPGRQRRREPP